MPCAPVVHGSAHRAGRQREGRHAEFNRHRAGRRLRLGRYALRSGSRNGSQSRGLAGLRSKNASRVSTASSKSISAGEPQPGFANWQGWWIMSPVITACWPFDARRIETCPGVWPGVFSSQIPSHTRWSESTRSTRPASQIGRGRGHHSRPINEYPDSGQGSSRNRLHTIAKSASALRST